MVTAPSLLCGRAAPRRERSSQAPWQRRAFGWPAARLHGLAAVAVGLALISLSGARPQSALRTWSFSQAEARRAVLRQGCQRQGVLARYAEPCTDASADASLLPLLSRRALFVAAPALLVGAAEAWAEDSGTAAGAPDIGQIFCGRYSDPNHPGGYREISVLDQWTTGGYRLAKVEGGGGRGEPPFFKLKAVVGRVEDAGQMVDVIAIDFTPKGGPPNFKGIWDNDGITFLRDRNHWPKKVAPAK